MKVRIVFSGRGYDRAAALPDVLTLPENASLDDALAALRGACSDWALPTTCLVAVSGVHAGTLAAHRGQKLADGDEVLLVAPVAGG